MNSLAKLAAAVCLAIAAAGMNWYWLSSQSTPPTYVAVKNAVEKDAPISAEDLQPIPVPGSRDKVRMTLVPYERRSILFGLNAPRRYEEGDMVFQCDIQASSQPPHWEVLGPYRLISVGEQFSASVNTTEGDSIGASGDNNVTIAVQSPFDEKTRQLLEVIDPERATSNDPEADARQALHIVAVQVYPPRADSQPADSPASATNFRLPLADDEVALFVSLESVENVPRVLLVGDEIGFVIASLSQ